MPIVVEVDEQGLINSINPDVESILASVSNKKRASLTDSTRSKPKKPDIETNLDEELPF